MEIKEVIKEYQCPGCVDGPNPESCSSFHHNALDKDKRCLGHLPGTFMTYIGRLFLGMPKGFNRLGEFEKMPINIFEKLEDTRIGDIWNIPTWFHVNEHGHTLVRGISPRVNRPFLDVILEDCSGRLKSLGCREITAEQIDGMD